MIILFLSNYTLPFSLILSFYKPINILDEYIIFQCAG